MKRVHIIIIGIMNLMLCSTQCNECAVSVGFYNQSSERVMFYFPTLFKNHPDITFKKMYIKESCEVGADGDSMWAWYDYDSIDEMFKDLGADTLSLFIWRGYKYRYDNTESGDRDVQMLARYDLSALDLESGIKITYPPSQEMLNAGMKVTLIPEEESDRYPGFLEAYAQYENER